MTKNTFKLSSSLRGRRPQAIHTCSNEVSSQMAPYHSSNSADIRLHSSRHLHNVVHFMAFYTEVCFLHNVSTLTSAAPGEALYRWKFKQIQQWSGVHFSLYIYNFHPVKLFITFTLFSATDQTFWHWFPHNTLHHYMDVTHCSEGHRGDTNH